MTYKQFRKSVSKRGLEVADVVFGMSGIMPKVGRIWTTPGGESYYDPNTKVVSVSALQADFVLQKLGVKDDEDIDWVVAFMLAHEITHSVFGRSKTEHETSVFALDALVTCSIITKSNRDDLLQIF